MGPLHPRFKEKRLHFSRTISKNGHLFLPKWPLTMVTSPRGATRMARGGIRLVHGLTKGTLITYFSGMKIDPKYAFLHAFFLIDLSCSFQNLSIWPKTHPFFPILHVFAPLKDVRAYSAWFRKTTLITWIFGRAWYHPWHSSGPPPGYEFLGSSHTLRQTQIRVCHPTLFQKSRALDLFLFAKWPPPPQQTR